MKIGLYTIFNKNNFGAQLQAYATQTFLQRYGFEAEIVDFKPHRKQRKNDRGLLKSFALICYRFLSPYIWKKEWNKYKFQKRLVLSRRYKTLDEIKNNRPQYDVHMVGSDQVWNVESGFPHLFFLTFLEGKALKISYASSFGNIKAALNYRQDITNALSHFKYISVREHDAAVFLTRMCGLDVKEFLDPVFLITNKEWDLLSGDKPIIEGKYILYYGFNRDTFTADVIKMIRAMLAMPVIGVASTFHSPYHYNRFCQSAGPLEFINLLKNSSFFLTSSFHGVAFSLIFKKQFAVIPVGTRMNRMESILTRYGLLNRIVYNEQQVKELIENGPMDYNYYNSMLKDITQSGEWLLESLNNLNLNLNSDK